MASISVWLRISPTEPRKFPATMRTGIVGFLIVCRISENYLDTVASQTLELFS